MCGKTKISMTSARERTIVSVEELGHVECQLHVVSAAGQSEVLLQTSVAGKALGGKAQEDDPVKGLRHDQHRVYDSCQVGNVSGCSDWSPMVNM